MKYAFVNCNILNGKNDMVVESGKCILVDDGKITGVGTHSELLESNTEYQEIYYSQNERKDA